MINRLFLLLTILCSWVLLSSQTHKSDTNKPKAQKVVCLSLKQLIKISSDNSSNVKALNLAKLNYVEGYVLDKPNQDIILIGKNLENRPSLFIDELAVNVANIWNALPAPYCSLDPCPDRLKRYEAALSSSVSKLDKKPLEEYLKRVSEALGHQTVVIGGVPKNSGHAQIMIEADYLMKRFSLGKTRSKSVKSCLDIMKELSSKSESPIGINQPSISRFWFHVSAGSPTYKAASKIVVVDSCRMVILTEKQRQTVDGRLQDAGTKDPVALAFANAHTAQFRSLADNYSAYASLDNLFRLHAILRALKFRNDDITCNLSLDYLRHDFQLYSPLCIPDTKPNLTNYSILERSRIVEHDSLTTIRTERYCPVVIGGVSMHMQVDDSRFSNDESLSALAEMVLSTRPSADSLNWSFVLPGE